MSLLEFKYRSTGISGNGISEEPAPTCMMSHESGLPRILFAACRHHQSILSARNLIYVGNVTGGPYEASKFPVNFCNVPARVVRFSGSLQEMSSQQFQSTVCSLLSKRKPRTQWVEQRDPSVLLSNPPFHGTMHCGCFSRHFSVWLSYSNEATQMHL